MPRPSVSPTAVFLVECYAPSSVQDGGTDVAERVSAACAGLRATDIEVEYLGALLMPDDELAFHVFMAADAGVVLEASRRAALRVERVVPSVAICRQPLGIVERERPIAHATGQIGPRADAQLGVDPGQVRLDGGD
jgi:hypothetical protein